MFDSYKVMAITFAQNLVQVLAYSENKGSYKLPSYARFRDVQMQNNCC